jgi:universal stress protein A
MFDRILVAVDLVPGPARKVLGRALALKNPAGEAWVIHVVEPQYVQYSVDPTFTGSLTRAMEEDALAAARSRLEEICAPFEVPVDRQLVILGRAAERIHEVAVDRAVDTIFVGSHARPGLRRLLGSTANAVLHGASVNVMTIRMQEDDQ